MLRVVQGALVAGVRRAQGAPSDAEPRLSQATERTLQTLYVRQQRFFFFHNYVFKHQLRSGGSAQGPFAFHFRRTETRRSLFNQEAPDAVLGLRPHHRHVRDGAVGDPHLGTVDAPLAAGLAHGLGEHSARIGSEVRLSQAKASDLFTLRHLGEPVLFLCFAAVGVNGPHHETALHRCEGAKARIATFQLVHQQTVGHAGKACAAVFLGQ